jgi:hypothetical protein
MAYARNDYTVADIEFAFREVDTNRSQGAQWDPNENRYRPGNTYGMNKKTGLPNFGLQPTPHPGIHGADALHSHPLFAAARIATGDATTHSVMDRAVMINALVPAFNSPAMTPFLAQLDGPNPQESVNVNVNFNATPGSCKVYSAKLTFAQNAKALDQAVVSMSLKVRRNPGNASIPIIQTAIPMTAALAVKNKKGAIGLTV